MRYQIGNITRDDIELTLITPEKAKELLDSSVVNRLISKPTVDAYARDLLAGRYPMNGDTFAIGKKEGLLDGHHRCWAVIKSGVAMPAILVHNLDDKAARMTKDSGRKRTFGDHLGMLGVQNANAVAAAVRGLHIFATGAYAAQPTKAEMDETFAAHPGIASSIALAKTSFPGVGTMISAVHYIMRFQGFDVEADDMVQTWRDGIPAYAGDPMHALRERLSRTRGTPSYPTTKTNWHLFATATNALLEGRSVKRILPSARTKINGWGVDDLL